MLNMKKSLGTKKQTKIWLYISQAKSFRFKQKQVLVSSKVFFSHVFELTINKILQSLPQIPIQRPQLRVALCMVTNQLKILCLYFLSSHSQLDILTSITFRHFFFVFEKTFQFALQHILCTFLQMFNKSVHVLGYIFLKTCVRKYLL